MSFLSVNSQDVGAHLLFEAAPRHGTMAAQKTV